MFKNFKFKQKGGNDSTNIQAVNYNTGISYEDAKNISLDVYQNNAHKLAAVAAEVAKNRAEEMTEEFLQELQKRRPEAINNVKDPDIQYALFNAQVQYARSGDKDLGEILVDLLVERTEVIDRDFKQIVLNEAIDVMSKLNKEQIDLLTLIFCLRSIRLPEIKSISALKTYLEDFFGPLFTDRNLRDNHFLHLEYCGCLNVERLGSSNLHSFFRNTYTGLFCNGFTPKEFLKQFNNFSRDVLSTLLMPNIHDRTRLQVNALSDTDFVALCEKLDLGIEEIGNLKDFNNKYVMDESQVIEFLTSLYPNYIKITELWESSDIKSSHLTTVGMAIAYTNLKRKIELSATLDEWIS
ncbi:hypothetical protein COJ67_16585 [Bacillus thuringiensis]|uniref:LPO_1073/Vpar_1526 family protein n=1 Tax=Bacillus thuringiensis TaxID=1428 RepID=UPI000BF47829|nr:LPO_1073/Vpar_1526 family protein [Bacillus thuringiensis]PFN86365.1 hypothetical protein COJ67_16585 [Bacillus thuringiensis]PGX99257.1 hypothetical protein COE41_17300 [Bacillus thuringiensis]